MTVVIYLLLVIWGWFSVCGASYDYVDRDFLDFSTRAGKQFVWIICSFGLGFVLLMLDDMFYDTFAYIIYAGMLVLLLVTIFIAPDTKGSRSWLILGPVSLQPAEFAKFATALALAKFMGAYGFVLQNWRNVLTIAFLIACPMLLIVGQRETGSALVYLSFFLMLYREGMPGAILFAGVCAVVYFVVGIRYADVTMLHDSTSVGEFAVLCLILISAPILLQVYQRNRAIVSQMTITCIAVVALACAISGWLWTFNVVYVLWGLCACAAGWLVFLALRERRKIYVLVSAFMIASVGFLYSCDYVFNQVLEPHQQIRIKVVLGLEEDLAGAGYNVNQSKIAIGSGGLWGKGFLNGTQTKLKYVLWILRAGNLLLPPVYQHRHGTWPDTRHRHSASVLQLRRFFFMGIYYSAVRIPADRCGAWEEDEITILTPTSLTPCRSESCITGNRTKRQVAGVSSRTVVT